MGAIIKEQIWMLMNHNSTPTNLSMTDSLVVLRHVIASVQFFQQLINKIILNYVICIFQNTELEATPLLNDIKNIIKGDFLHGIILREIKYNYCTTITTITKKLLL